MDRETIPVNSIALAKRLVLFVAYYERDTTPQFTTKDRDALIRIRCTNGESVSTLAQEYGISTQRVYQILREQRK